MIEDKHKIIDSKDDSTIDKYVVEAVNHFYEILLADFSRDPRKDPNIGQLKVFLGAISPDGITWDYSGTLRLRLGPLYKAIQSF